MARTYPEVFKFSSPYRKEMIVDFEGSLGDTFTTIITVTSVPVGFETTKFIASEMVDAQPNDFFNGMYVRGHKTAAGVVKPGLIKIKDFVKATGLFELDVAAGEVFTIGDILHIIPAWMAAGEVDGPLFELLGVPDDGTISDDIYNLRQVADASEILLDGIGLTCSGLDVAVSGLAYVVGELDDVATTEAGDTYSVVSYLKGTFNLVDTLETTLTDKRSKVFPTLADGVALTTSATPWTHGTAAEFVGASSIAEAFVIDSLVIEAATVADVYEVEFYTGGTIYCTVRFVRTANYDAMVVPVECLRIPASTQVMGKIAGKAGSGVATISINYHAVA